MRLWHKLRNCGAVKGMKFAVNLEVAIEDLL